VLGQQVREEQRMAYDMNVTGVPAMLVNGKFLIPGAQDPETYANALRRVVAREAELAARQQ
jgi:predicted DsbA family dithiol-disulfide isomerase